jgi:hypothetical protein
MAALSETKRDEIKQLYYQKGFSARQISEHFSVSLDAVYYAMRRFKMKRRTRTEANAAHFALKPLSFSLRQRLTADEEILKTLGIALYWGEGYKTQKAHGIDFVNSDVRMVLVFLAFLRRVCGIDEKKLRVLLYCHTQSKISAHIRYWSHVTCIPRSQFTKPYVTKRVSKKGQGMPHGLIHLRYSDKKLLDLIRLWIRKSSDQYCVGGRVVNYTSL